MRDHHQRRASVAHQIQQQVEHAIAGGLVQIAGRFIRKDQRGAVGQRAGDGDALLLAARQILGVTPRQGADAQTLGQHGTARGVVSP